MPKGLKPKTKRNFLLKTTLIIIIAVIAVTIAIAAAVIHNISSRIGNSQTYVNNWSALQSIAGLADVSAESTAQESTLSAVSGEAVDVEGRNYPIVKEDQIDKNIANILIIGTDAGNEKSTSDHRSDTMIVASINKKENTVKLTSIMRDIKAYFPVQKDWEKINKSYQLGGPGYTVNIINYNFGLDIQNYVVVNFSGFKKIVDAAGGVDITLTKKETQQISGISTKVAGTYHLNGSEALDYARIRHIDSDFIRVKRQKTVILALFKNFKAMNIAEQASLANTCLDYVKTNMSTSEALSLALTLGPELNSKFDEYTIPASGMYTEVNRPVFYFKLKWSKQKTALYNFIYG